jgi:hypothetical protein
MSFTIHFLNGNDQNIQFHYSEKGYRNDIIVQINDTYYEVYFHTKDDLTYEMTDDGFSMPGLIILEGIHHDKIVKSIKNLHDIGYFNWFVGSDKMQFEKQFMSKWYINEMSTYDKNKLVSIQIHVDT